MSIDLKKKKKKKVRTFRVYFMEKKNVLLRLVTNWIWAVSVCVCVRVCVCWVGTEVGNQQQQQQQQQQNTNQANGQKQTHLTCAAENPKKSGLLLSSTTSIDGTGRLTP